MYRTTWRGVSRAELDRMSRMPDPTLEEAERALADAVRSGDQVRIFIARGDVQRMRRTRTL